MTILQQHSLPAADPPHAFPQEQFTSSPPMSPSNFSPRQRVGSNHSAAIESLVEALGTNPSPHSPVMAPSPVPEAAEPLEVETRSNSTATAAPISPAMSRGDPQSASSHGAAAQKKKRGLFGAKKSSAAAHVSRSSSDEVDHEKSAAAANSSRRAGTGPAPLKFRHHSFWDPKLAMQRSIFFKGFIPFIVLTTVLIVWGFVSIYVS